MKITVIEQAKRFWLAHKMIDKEEYKWKPVIGHEIQVGDYRFFVAPIDFDTLNISEVTTGLKAFEMKLTPLDHLFTETKEDTMRFYRDIVAVKLRSAIERVPDFGERLIQEQEKQIALFGEMPKIEDFDETIITAPINEIMN